MVTLSVMPGRGTPKITLRVDPALWARFGRAAAAAGVPRAELLRELIRWYVRDQGARLPQRPNDEEAKEPR